MKLKIKKINFYLLGLSVLFILFFVNKEIINFLGSIFPKVKLEIKNIDENKKDLIIFTKNLNFKIDKNNKSVEIIPKGKYGYSQEALWLKNRNVKLEVKIKKIPSSKISFYNIGSNKVEISSNKNKKILNLKNSPKGEVLEYFPFKKSKIFFIYLVIFYIILTVLIYKILFLFAFGEEFKKESEKDY